MATLWLPLFSFFCLSVVTVWLLILNPFKKVLLPKQFEEGWLETALPSKPNHQPLGNRIVSLQRLNSLVRKLKRTDMLGDYDGIIQEQVKQCVVEKSPNEAVGREFYVPHRAVGRENAETRIVYDAST